MHTQAIVCSVAIKNFEILILLVCCFSHKQQPKHWGIPNMKEKSIVYS